MVDYEDNWYDGKQNPREKRLLDILRNNDCLHFMVSYILEMNFSYTKMDGFILFILI